MNKTQKMEKIAILLLLNILIVTQSQGIIADGCVQFSAGSCTRCKRQAHVYQGFCYKNILGCTQYKNANECAVCEPPTFELSNGRCNAIGGEAVEIQLANQLYKYSGQYQSNPGEMYGQASFMPTTFQTVKKWPSFLALDTFIRRGQYGHFISRMSNPIYSVHYYQNKDIYIYKVLYYGSGGGLFLCIADVPPSYRVQLRSLTPISASNVIYNCWDYDTNGRCVRCKQSDHLQNGKCYPNYGGCVRYMQNICIQCLDRYLLAENRCVSDCLSVSDARSLLYYEGNRNMSTMEKTYGIAIKTFYISSISISTRTTTTYSVTPAAQAVSPVVVNSKIVTSSRSSVVENPNILSSSFKSSGISSVMPVVSSPVPLLSTIVQPATTNNTTSTSTLVLGTGTGILSSSTPVLGGGVTIIKQQQITNTNTNTNNNRVSVISSTTVPTSSTIKQSKQLNIQTTVLNNSSINGNINTNNNNNINSMNNNRMEMQQIAKIQKISTMAQQIGSSANTNFMSTGSMPVVSNITQLAQSIPTLPVTNTLVSKQYNIYTNIPPNVPIYHIQTNNNNNIGTTNSINTNTDDPNYLSNFLDSLFANTNTTTSVSSMTVSSSTSSSSSSVQHCNQYKNGKCIKCVQFYFINQQGKCQQLSMLCVSVSQVDGKCTKCFVGYKLNKGKCQITELY